MSEYKIYQTLQNLGLLKGYWITGDNDEKMCEVCQAEQGYHSDFSSSSKFPPFHPNCRCKMELDWRFKSGENQTLRDVYDPYTGEIKDGATRELILDALNNALKDKGLEVELTWEDVVDLGFYDANGKEIEDYVDDVSEIVGGTTFLDASKVINVDASPLKSQRDTLDYWLEKAKWYGGEINANHEWDPVITKNLNILMAMNAICGDDKELDLKKKTDTVFGEMKTNKEKMYLGYIYDGEYIRHDLIGNILIGYMGYFAGIDLDSLLLGVNATSLFMDDPKDQEAIRKGYEMAQAE